LTVEHQLQGGVATHHFRRYANGKDLNLAQMGMPDGIILSGGQRQGGVSFTLPSDQVVCRAVDR
jgi:hypothetical protein